MNSVPLDGSRAGLVEIFSQTNVLLVTNSEVVGDLKLLL